MEAGNICTRGRRGRRPSMDYLGRPWRAGGLAGRRCKCDGFLRIQLSIESVNVELLGDIDKGARVLTLFRGDIQK